MAWRDACSHVTAVNFAAGGQTKPHTKAPSLAEMPSSLLTGVQTQRSKSHSLLKLLF